MTLWTDQETRIRTRPPGCERESTRERMERQLRALLDPDVVTVIRGAAIAAEVLFFPEHFDQRCPSCGPHPRAAACPPGCPCLCHDAPARGHA